MEVRIHCYVLDLQMAIHKKSSQYFVGTNQISVFYLHFDVRLAFIMIVTIYNFVNFTNKLLGPFFSLSKLESKCLRFFKVSYSGVVKHFFFLFLLLLTKMLSLLKKIDIHVVLMFKSVHWQMKMYFYIQLDWGEDFVGIFFFWKFCILQFIHRLLFFKRKSITHLKCLISFLC